MSRGSLCLDRIPHQDGGLIAQRMGFTKDMPKERYTHVYFQLNKIFCGFKDQASPHPGEKCKPDEQGSHLRYVILTQHVRLLQHELGASENTFKERIRQTVVTILIQGQLYHSWEEARSHSETFQFRSRTFRDQVFTGQGLDRYVLVAGKGDPWSHRVTMARALLGLEHSLEISYVDEVISKDGWRLVSPLDGYEYVYQMYLANDAEFTGRISVPFVWDRLEQCIANNESADILRMLNAYNIAYLNHDRAADLYPKKRAKEIDGLNGYIQDEINNAVYKVGFSPTQEIYDKMLSQLYDALENLDQHLSTQRYLSGPELCEADLRLFATLVRFDIVYYPCLRCCKKRLQDFHHLWPYTKEIYQTPQIRPTVNFDAIRKMYFSLGFLNPSLIIPAPTDIDFDSKVTSTEYMLYSAPFHSP